MEKKKIYKWAFGENAEKAIELLKKEGGTFIPDLYNNTEIFYMPYPYGLIEHIWSGGDSAKYVKANGIEIKKREIIDDTERKYLSDICRPFIDKVIGVTKKTTVNNCEYIRIEYSDNECDVYMPFPNFKKGTMYRGMELNKKYTPSDLNLK